MSTLHIPPDLDLHYTVDRYSEPWREPETVLMLHGNSESGEAWYGWVPHLARHFRVVRPDMRGFGRSSAMRRDYVWSLDRIITDFTTLMDHLGIRRFHLVGAKIGATVALRFAATHPDRVRTLGVVGGLASGRESLGDRAQAWYDHLSQHGVESWARWTMPGRLGADFPPEGAEWWAKLMGATSLDTQLGFMTMVPGIDLLPDLPKIACPTQVITTEGSGLGSVERTRAWQTLIPRSELLVLPGASYHVAATAPDACARATLDFIQRHAGA